MEWCAGSSQGWGKTEKLCGSTLRLSLMVRKKNRGKPKIGSVPVDSTYETSMISGRLGAIDRPSVGQPATRLCSLTIW